MYCFQETIPARFKVFYLYNTGAAWDAFFNLVMPFFTKKMRERVSSIYRVGLHSPATQSLQTMTFKATNYRLILYCSRNSPVLLI